MAYIGKTKGSNITEAEFQFTATAGQTIFNINTDNTYLTVFINGILIASEDIVIGNNNITLNTPCESGDIIIIKSREINGTTGGYSQAQADSKFVNKTGDETFVGIKTFSSSPIVPTPTTDMQAATKKYVDEQILIEQTTTPIIGLMWNQTDDMYKRIGKNINTLTIDGFNEFSAWRSVTAERQNYYDT
jgi:hypothetical protein